MDTEFLENRLFTAMQEAHIPGMAVAVIEAGDIVYLNGFGYTSSENGSRLPINRNTLFRIGSVTKPLTAMLIMRLVEEGKLSLDKPIGDYLPWLKILDYRADREVTLRMLLSHVSGLPTRLSYQSRWYSLQDYIEQVIPNIRFVAPPGMLYYYSNLGYNLAACVAEVVTDSTYADLMDEYVFSPLKMNDTTFDILEAMTHPLALSHELDEEGRVQVKRPFIDNPNQHPAGFAMSSVMDLTSFMMMQLQDGRYAGAQILSQESVKAMQTKQAERYAARQAGYGLGLRSYNYKGIRLIGHNGAIHKYGAMMWMCPDEQMGVAMLYNRAPNFWDTATEIIHAIFDKTLNLTRTEEVSTVPMRPTMWEGYTGTYLGDRVGLVQIIASDKYLKVQVNDQAPLLLVNTKDNIYMALLDNGKRLAVAFPEEGYIMVNGEMCKRFDYMIQNVTIPEKYEGVFVGDLDTYKLQVGMDRLYLTSEDERREFPCIPVGDKLFACDLGTLEFRSDDMLVWANAFEFTRQTESKPILPHPV